MRNSLLIKLLGAFLLVITIGTGLTYGLTSLATQNAFNIYSTRSGQAWAQNLAVVLADYYQQNNSWQGVDVLIQTDLNQTDNSTHGMGAGKGANQGMGRRMGSSLGQRILLTDEKGMVINDSNNQWVGKQFTAAELANGAPVMVGDRQVATVLVIPNDFAGPGTPAREFLSSVNQSILISAAIAGVIALLLGGFLFFQITSPLQQLKKAAKAIAEGDLSQRVNIKTGDEFGDLGGTFNQMAENLKKSETQRHNMIADIAHELRNPLSVIRANLEGFMDDVLPVDDAHIQIVYSETLLLNRLVDDLRLLTLAEAGELKLEMGRLNLGALVQQVVSRNLHQSQLKQVKLEAEIAANLNEVWADSDRISQILNNLISNALRYTPENGAILIKAENQPGSSHFVQISVTDNGSGMDPLTLPYVFERFYRGDKSRTRTSGGSGLGLAIVKQLVKAHGGEVQALSPVYWDAQNNGFGTRIIFSLPVGCGD